ncbi:MAG: SDR family NAD(P)-dependent oxidoreductase [bacterium]
MDKKICVITGANSGIGKAAAIQIINKGYFVILGCRNKGRGEKALKEIQEITKSNSVELMIVDMVSQKSITGFVNSLNQKFNKIDVLINNAAEFDISSKKITFSPEGIETVWATNHVGAVLLTNLLLSKLELSDQGRIINISSKGLVMFPFLKVNINDPEFTKGKYRVVKAYYQSKLAQVMFTYWLAEKLKSTCITANCIRVTNVKIDISRYPNISKIQKIIYLLKSKFSISTDQMAKTYTYLATSKNVNNITGKYFNENNKVISSNAYSSNIDNINGVMEKTFEYIK